MSLKERVNQADTHPFTFITAVHNLKVAIPKMPLNYRSKVNLPRQVNVPSAVVGFSQT